jgi:hypothetical protein
MNSLSFPPYIKTKGEARALIDQLFPKEADAALEQIIRA